MKFWNIIRETVKDYLGKYSITRVSSYFLLATILLNSLVYIGIDIVNAIKKWSKNDGDYVIPWNHIIIFSMILTHHLILLGLKKSTDSKAMDLMPQPLQQKEEPVEEGTLTPDSPELPEDK